MPWGWVSSVRLFRKYKVQGKASLAVFGNGGYCVCAAPKFLAKMPMDLVAVIAPVVKDVCGNLFEPFAVMRGKAYNAIVPIVNCYGDFWKGLPSGKPFGGPCEHWKHFAAALENGRGEHRAARRWAGRSCCL